MTESPSLDVPYRFRAYCERVIDGDTYQLRADLGFHVALSIPVRLRGVNTPEIRGDEKPRGDAAKAWVEELLRPAILFWEQNGSPTPLIVESYKDTQSFARWVCDVWLAGDDETPARSLSEAIIEAGHGEPA